MDIRNELEQLRDEKYREFGLSLLPNADKSKMIGVRLPQLRAVAARIKKKAPRALCPISRRAICLKKACARIRYCKCRSAVRRASESGGGFCAGDR